MLKFNDLVKSKASGSSGAIARVINTDDPGNVLIQWSEQRRGRLTGLPAERLEKVGEWDGRTNSYSACLSRRREVPIPVSEPRERWNYGD